MSRDVGNLLCGFCSRVEEARSDEKHPLVEVCANDGLVPFIYPVEDGRVQLRVWVCMKHSRALGRMVEQRGNSSLA